MLFFEKLFENFAPPTTDKAETPQLASSPARPPAAQMAQLNPNFEIDFEDINSYEQIQLINDTQQAKEDLLQRRAYREPADEALIRNQFSSFTFVDFCPKLFASPQEQGSHELASAAGRSSASLRHRYELETFSDLFERINQWLRLNRDWRVVSMETLVFDCVSQFNHLESSVYARHLPRNMRGLRLFLSPSKARFCGAQRIGCINVVPRKLAGNYGHRQQPLAYESLDQILARLNELLLTRPIEGKWHSLFPRARTRESDTHLHLASERASKRRSRETNKQARPGRCRIGANAC